MVDMMHRWRSSRSNSHAVKLSGWTAADTMREFRSRANRCWLLRKGRSLLVRQMTGEDGLHQRIAGLGAGDHVPDLLIDLLGWQPSVLRRLRDCRISIEHISAGDVVAIAERDPAQRSETCGERECWL